MVNKFDRPVQKDWSWQTAQLKAPTLDYEMLNSIAMEKQAEYDNIASLNALVPNALQNPDDLAKQQEYRALVEQGTKATTDAYMKSASAGAMSYRDFKNQVQKAWQPGGSADMLNKRYQGYYAAEKAIDEYYKDDTSPVNKTLAKQRLKEQAAQPTGWDPATGKYNVINTPELYKNPNINKAINEMLSEIKANGDTQFLGDQNKSWWLQKIQTETREPERIKLAYQALSSQPEYAAQIQRDADYKSMTIDPAKHQAAYENTLNTNLANLTQTAEDAKKDKQSTIDWQNTLRQQGYNVKADGDFGALTEKATKEFLDSQKQSVADGVSKYNFKNQMISEVDKGYLGYALRGAYKKVDGDLLFNQAKKAQMDFSLKKEENSINMWRAQMEFAPKDQASTTAVSSIAQQLPEIQTYHKDLKDQLSATEKKVDESLNKSKTFKGWTKENVAEAYNTWNKVTGNTPEERKANYKALLAQKSDYPFTDEQVNMIFEEMNGAGDGMIKTTLKTLGQLQSEVGRVEEGQAHIASQYINTPEGRENLKSIERYRTPGETDQQLATRAINNPGDFNRPYKGNNPMGEIAGARPQDGVDFVSKMNRQIKDNPSKTQYDWGSLGTVEIYANSDDKVLKPTLDGISQALETGTGLNFSSFGQAGLVYKNKDGEEVDAGKSRKVVNMAPTVGLKGQPVIRVGMSITGERGGSYAAFTDIDVVPGSVEQVQLMTGMKKAYVEKLKNEGAIAAQPYLDVIESLQGKDGMDRGAIDSQVKSLNLNNTSDNTIYTTEYNPITGEPTLVDVTKYGWKSKNLEKDENIGGYGYELWGFNTATGNVVGNTFIDSQGRRILSPAVGQPGAFTFGSSDAALKDRQGKYILSETPVEVKETKVNRSGQSQKTTEITKTTKSE